METENKRQAKEWTKPELLVLARSNPEEQVLTTCKWAGGYTPMGAWRDCWTSPEVTCNALAAS